MELETLLTEYERQIRKLVPLLPSYEALDDRWTGFRNRFFDVRWDDKFYTENVERNCRCERVVGDDISFLYCTCDIEIPYKTIFVDDACPEKLCYGRVAVTRVEPDVFGLRVRVHTKKPYVSLDSIPQIRRNLRRLDRELVRQEQFKWCMAHVRSRGLGCHWSVPNELCQLVQIELPREILVLIMYWVGF